MPRTYGRKNLTSRNPGWDGSRFLCPQRGCSYKTTSKKVYKVHYQAKHIATYPFICEQCLAGFNRGVDLTRHLTRCLGSKEANDMRRCKKLNYVQNEQFEASLPSAPEEEVQDLREQIRRLQETNEEKEEGLRVLRLTLTQEKDSRKRLVERLYANLSVDEIVRLGIRPSKQIDTVTTLDHNDNCMIADINSYNSTDNSHDDYEMEEVVERDDPSRPMVVEHDLGDPPPVYLRPRRTTAAALKKEARRNLLNLLQDPVDKNRGLEQRLVTGKQRAIFSTRDFTRKEYVIEYAGTLMLGSKAKDLAKEYALDPSIGCYQYYFRYR